MKAEVVTVSSYDPKQPYYRPNAFRASLGKFGVVPTNLGYNEEWHGLMTKPRLYRKFLREGRQQGDLLIICDSWDVFFAAHPDEVVAIWKQNFSSSPNGSFITFNAERSCFPCAPDTTAYFDAVADRDKKIGTPWRYLNSGFMVGTGVQILKLLEAMDLDFIPDDYQRPDGSWFNPNDQEQFQLAFLKQPAPMCLDYYTELCMAAHGSTLEELDFSGPRIKNKITGTTPLVFHCNGSAKNDLAPAILEHLGLPQK